MRWTLFFVEMIRECKSLTGWMCVLEASDCEVAQYGLGLMFCAEYETGRAVANTVASEVVTLFAAIWLVLNGLLYSLQLSTGSFLRPLTAQEEEYYLKLSAQGDLEARNILIERNLRLVAHIMKKY